MDRAGGRRDRQARASPAAGCRRADWQRFWRSEGLGDVKTIATGLSEYDVHPPLYFGLLHGWLLAGGETCGRAARSTSSSRPSPCSASTAWRAPSGSSSLEGALAALVWAVSPAVVGISAIARQYDLLALATVLLVWGLVRTTSVRAAAPAAGAARRWPDIVWLAAATAAALLTHYQAILLVAGAAVWAVAGVPRRGADGGRRPWWPPLLGLAAGVLVAMLLAPGWRDALTRERGKLDGFSRRAWLRSRRDRRHARPVLRRDRPGADDRRCGALVAVLIVLLARPRTSERPRGARARARVPAGGRFSSSLP